MLTIIAQAGEKNAGTPPTAFCAHNCPHSPTIARIRPHSHSPLTGLGSPSPPNAPNHKSN